MDKLQKYVNLIVQIGVNIQPGQKLLIFSPVDAAYFARMIMEQAYKIGVADVVICWEDEVSDRIDYLLSPNDDYDKVLEWEKARVKHWVDDSYNVLTIYAPNSELSVGVNPKHIEMKQKAVEEARQPLYNQGWKVQWGMAYVPTTAWANKVFPNAKDTKEAESLMWEAIYSACRIDENEPMETWHKHIEHLQNKIDALAAHNFKHLHFKTDAGTDLEVELPQEHVWMSCVGESTMGNKFVANIPTEEVFTAPLRTGVNGIVYATKPMVYMGKVIDGFWLRFKDGKVVDYDAKENKHVLKELLTTHDNADYLGEVALVPHSSPISQLNVLWYDSSFDENASCHLALGYAYPNSVKGASKGILNQSSIHEDFMIGTSDMDIMGTTQAGEEIFIFKQGEWAI
ncbi:MAG: aminopeptidase [Oscillospiraceae bacterium]|nr:aminopeptidase [Oscillospiraceae bacterium]